MFQFLESKFVKPFIHIFICPTILIINKNWCISNFASFFQRYNSLTEILYCRFPIVN